MLNLSFRVVALGSMLLLGVTLYAGHYILLVGGR